MSQMRSVLTHPETRVTMGERAIPTPVNGQITMDVKAFSLNRGELNFAANKEAGTPIGWDVAGTVRDPGSSSFAKGDRVVAMVAARSGWAEVAIVPSTAAARLPDSVSFEQAAALPVAAGTALACLDASHTPVLGERVLVTGATGGVGSFAVQLARIAGAHVTAQVRKPEQVQGVKALGAHEVVVTSDGAALKDHAPFRLAIDGVGGALFQAVIASVDPDGTAVNYGVTAGASIDLPLGMMLGKGRAHVRGLNLYAVSDVTPPAQWLSRLVRLVELGSLEPAIERRASWDEVQTVAAELMDRKFTGKAVLSL